MERYLYSHLLMWASMTHSMSISIPVSMRDHIKRANMSLFSTIHSVPEQHLNVTKVLGLFQCLKALENYGEFFQLNRNSITMQLFLTLIYFCRTKLNIVSAKLQLSVQYSNRVHNGCKFPELILIIWNFWISQKAAEVLNFCLIRKILHNFPMHISNGPAPKTFLCIQMLL